MSHVLRALHDFLLTGSVKKWPRVGKRFETPFWKIVNFDTVTCNLNKILNPIFQKIRLIIFIYMCTYLCIHRKWVGKKFKMTRRDGQNSRFMRAKNINY